MTAVGILELALPRYSPRLVVFDCEPAFDIYEHGPDQKDTRYLQPLKPYYRQKGIPDIFKDVSREEWLKVQSGMVRYNTEIVRLLFDHFENRPMDFKGYSPLEGSTIKDGTADWTEDRTDAIDPLKVKYFDKLLSLCKENGVPVVVVASPKYRSGDTSHYKPVKDICARHGVRFIDHYSDPLFMSHPEWFKEHVHLNRTGAKVFSSMIAGDIQEYLQGDGA